MENPPFQFPMSLTIRCYDCGKVFDVSVTSLALHEFPCPDCGKIEVFDLGQLQRKAIAKQEKMSRQSGGRQ